MTVRAEQEVTLTRVDDGAQGANGTTFTPSVSAAGDISWTNDGGKTNPPTQNIKGPEGDEGPAGKTAYESAVDGGYTGTEAEFNSDLSQVSDVTQHFWYDNDGAHVAEVDQDTFTQNPQGANTLIDSNGLSMRDGTTTLASFSAGGATIGQDNGARTEVTSFGVDLYDEKGIPAISIKSSGAQGTVWKKTSYKSTRKNSASSTKSITDDCIAGATYYITHGTGTRTECTQGTSKTISTTAYNSTTGTNVPITLVASASGTGNITVTTSATGSVTGSITVSYTVEYPVLADMASIELSGVVSVNGNAINEIAIENGVKAGNHGTWFYRKWSSGMVEAWYNMDTAISVNFNSSSSVAGTYRKDTAITIPSGIFPAKPNFGMVNVQQDSTTIHGEFHPVSATSGTVYWTRDATGTANITASIYVSLIPQSI